jgi:hypothetical protein
MPLLPLVPWSHHCHIWVLQYALCSGFQYKECVWGTISQKSSKSNAAFGTNMARNKIREITSTLTVNCLPVRFMLKFSHERRGRRKELAACRGDKIACGLRPCLTSDSWSYTLSRILQICATGIVSEGGAKRTGCTEQEAKIVHYCAWMVARWQWHGRGDARALQMLHCNYRYQQMQHAVPKYSWLELHGFGWKELQSGLLVLIPVVVLSRSHLEYANISITNKLQYHSS